MAAATAAASPSLSATRPPPYLTTSTTSSSSTLQVYYAPHTLPGSSSSLSFSSAASISKPCNFFLLNRTEKRCTRLIHVQACRSLGFPFNSYESTEATSMDGHERDRDSQRSADRVRYRNTAVLSGKEKLKTFGQVNKPRISPSLPQKQKTTNSERSRFMNERYAIRNDVEPDILGDGIDASNVFANDEEKQTPLSSQKQKHGVMPQKYMFPQRSHSQNRLYAYRNVVEFNHGKGGHASALSGNEQEKQRSLYSNQLIENGHGGNQVNAFEIPANKLKNQRSSYFEQQVENGQRSFQNPPHNFFANEQEKQMSLYSDNQQIDNGKAQNNEPPNSIGAGNGEQAPVFSSKLEEILAKFKKKPGSHKDPRPVRVLQTGNYYDSSLYSSHPQYVEADMVQDKDVTLKSKKTGWQNSRINLNTSENGRKTGQNHHKQGRSSLFNDEVDIFWKEMSSLEQDDAGDSSRENLHLNVSGNSTPWRMKRRTSTSVGSRSNPSRSSVSLSDAMGMLGEMKPSLEKDDVGISSKEKSTFKLSDRSPIPFKAGRQHSFTGKPHIQTQKGRYTSVSTGSHSNPSRPSVLSSDAKNLRHIRSHSNIDKITEKASHDEEENNEITNLERTRISNDMSRVNAPNQDFRSPVNEVGFDTSDSDGEYDSGWSIDSDDNEDDNAVMQHDHHSSMSTPDKAPSPSFSSEVMDRKVSSRSLDKPKVATWHKHSIPDIPFEFQYSYTETPKSPVVRYRETPFSPFGPSTMDRPWTGRAPLKPSKKKLPEFDSFKPPPKNRKGIKFVQDPGPYPKGTGPKPSKTRDEIMGEPLSKEEIQELVESCYKERRQLNLGRDGLTHNMLDLIHCHWKRRRVCKVKCIGVPTLDMDNVCFHVEDKTGGKIIYRSGGILYLYRGRNYNYKDRPKFPLMLWKPVTPVYPKLIQEAPDGLTKEEAKKLRQLGEKVEPMCKLAKNGVYLSLVEDTRAAFKVDKLVRIDCRGLNPSDYKKIGAKLKDLVPCVLLSFDNEHILMWKGIESNSALSDTQAPQSSGQNTILEVSPKDESLSSPSVSFGTLEDENGDGESDSESFGDSDNDSEGGAMSPDIVGGSNIVSSLVSSSTSEMDNLTEEENGVDLVYSNDEQCDSIVLYIDDLWEGAISSGMALELNENDSDNDVVAKKAWELAKSAPAGPSYTERLISKLQLKTEKSRKPVDEVRIHFGKPKKKQNRPKYQPSKTNTVDVPRSGGLPVSELARLLASR